MTISMKSALFVLLTLSAVPMVFSYDQARAMSDAEHKVLMDECGAMDLTTHNRDLMQRCVGMYKSMMVDKPMRMKAMKANKMMAQRCSKETRKKDDKFLVSCVDFYRSIMPKPKKV